MPNMTEILAQTDLSELDQIVMRSYDKSLIHSLTVLQWVAKDATKFQGVNAKIAQGYSELAEFFTFLAGQEGDASDLLGDYVNEVNNRHDA